jgi:hypothetical protein
MRADDPGARHVPVAHRLAPIDVLYQILGEERGTLAWLEVYVLDSSGLE